MCAYVGMDIWRYVCTYAWMNGFRHNYMNLCMYLYVCMGVSKYVCMYVCELYKYIQECMHTECSSWQDVFQTRNA